MGNKQNKHIEENKIDINPEDWYIFDEKQNKWIPRKEATKNSIQSNEIKIQNQNIWFNHKTNERFPKILEMLEKKNADFICLQEVTSVFIKLLCENEFFQKNYVLSDIEESKKVNWTQWYGSMIIMKKQFEGFKLKRITFPSNQGRFLVVAYGLLNERTTAISTSHFESTDESHEKRCEQLDITFNELKQYQESFVCGDFNYDGNDKETPEKKHFPTSNLIDMWPTVNPNDPGYTEDTNINLMRLSVTNKPKTVRYDQLFHHYSDSSLYLPTSCEIIGKEPFGDNLWISDHFGLFSVFKLK
eukprot:TRINITY_DN6178_c0_g1_i1.p1 TRINITY_DN6178_c0_g1~~TRINITY_DN6178_c0_g1_i1.p1  ORF type:complete len:301 (+),score=66.73 TRINITY_DN6178_c0_g1_i1:15-917(+)